MTRKDYVRFAAMLKELRLRCSDNELELMDTISDNLSDILCADNPNFDRARFLKACGVES